MTEKTEKFTELYVSGLYISGEVAGVKKEIINTVNGPQERHTLGLRIETGDAYGGVSAELAEVRLSREAVVTGLVMGFEAARGRSVAVPVWVQAWTGKRGPGFTLMLDTKNKILGLE